MDAAEEERGEGLGLCHALLGREAGVGRLECVEPNQLGLLEALVVVDLRLGIAFSLLGGGTVWDLRCYGVVSAVPETG